MVEKQLKTNQSVEKAFSIIEIMAQEKRSMKLQEISKKAQLPQATTLRLLYTLMTLGYVTQDSVTSLYSLTLRFSYIGHRVESQLDIRSLIKPFLIEIARECGEAACLSILDSDELLYIDTVDSQDNILTAAQRIGKRAPLYCTGAGKIYLSHMPEKELNHYLNHHTLTQLTSHTITTEAELRSELNTIQKEGVAYDNEECELGVKCIAFPIYDYKGNIAATASVSGPINRMTSERLDMIHEKMTRYIGLLENTLAYTDQKN